MDSLSVPKNTFTGWNAQKDGTGKFYIPGATIDIAATKNNQAITLYAVWEYDLAVNFVSTFLVQFSDSDVEKCDICRHIAWKNVILNIETNGKM